MKLFNNTNKIQEVKVSDRYGKCYSVFIEANRSADFEEYQITRDVVNKVKSGILTNLDNPTIPPTLVIEPILVQEQPPIVESAPVEEKGEDKNPEEETPSEKTGTHICEICGSEYASERGLAMHISRSHQE